jgi:hypothetical protein
MSAAEQSKQLQLSLPCTAPPVSRPRRFYSYKYCSLICLVFTGKGNLRSVKLSLPCKKRNAEEKIYMYLRGRMKNRVWCAVSRFVFFTTYCWAIKSRRLRWMGYRTCGTQDKCAQHFNRKPETDNTWETRRTVIQWIIISTWSVDCMNRQSRTEDCENRRGMGSLVTPRCRQGGVGCGPTVSDTTSRTR